MRPGFLATSAGNYALMRHEYSEALSYYERAAKLAKASNSNRERFDAYLNSSIAAAKMDNKPLVDHYVAKAAKLPFLNFGDIPSCGADHSDNSNDTAPEPVHSTILCIESISSELYKNPANAAAIQERCEAYVQLENYELAMKDAITWTELEPNSLDAWSRRAEISFRVGDAEGLQNACKRIERLGSTAHRFQAQYWVMLGDFEKSEKELRMASECEEPGAREAWREHALKRGKYGMAGVTENDFVYHFFVKDTFPSNLSSISDIYVRHLIAGYFKSFHSRIHDLGPTIGCDPTVLEAWITGDDSLIHANEPELPDPLLPEGFTNFFVGTDDELRQLCRARDIVNPNITKSVVLNQRYQFCMSLAAVEISQAIEAWIKDSTARLPTFDLLLTILVSWIRVAAPEQPVVSIVDVDLRPLVMGIAKLHGDTSRSHCFGVLKRCLEKGLPGDMREKVFEAKAPEELISLFSRNISCRIPRSNLEMFVTRENTGEVSFGIRVTDCIDGKHPIIAELLRSWTEALMSLKRGELSSSIFEFLRYWLLARPIRASRGFSYMIVVLTSFLLVLGYQPSPEAVWDEETERMAMVSTNLEDFMQHFSRSRFPLVKTLEFPSVERALPNMQARFNFIKPVSM